MLVPVASVGRLVNTAMMKSSWAWRSGSHPISVENRSSITRVSLSTVSVPPIELHPALTPISPASNRSEMRVRMVV